MEKLIFWIGFGFFIIIKAQIDHIFNGIENMGNPDGVTTNAYNKAIPYKLWSISMLIVSGIVFAFLYINEFTLVAVLSFVGFVAGYYLLDNIILPLTVYLITWGILPRGKILIGYFRLLQMIELFMFFFLIHLFSNRP